MDVDSDSSSSSSDSNNEELEQLQQDELKKKIEVLENKVKFEIVKKILQYFVKSISITFTFVYYVVN